jgi:hypothetical protein
MILDFSGEYVGNNGYPGSGWRFKIGNNIFNIHDVQLIIIFISLTKIKDIVENLNELPNRILPNLAHLLILCVFTSVLCGVNKEVKENNNNNTKPNPILAFYIQTRGDTYLPLHQMRTELSLLKRPVLPATNTAGALQQITWKGRPCIFAILNFEENMKGIEETN